VVIILSSHFVQRGEPAFLDKWARTEMALRSGADLVIELPVVYSCHNAGVFANAAVDILQHTGVVRYISCGMETPSPLLNTISDILIQEPEPFKHLLRHFLDQGLSFVEARTRSLEKTVPGASAIMEKPNNTLALAYIKRIREKKYPLELVPVQRIASDYHEESMQGNISSATSIRKAVRKGELAAACQAIPASAREILLETISSGRAVMDRDILWRLIKTTLLRSEPEDLARYAEISEGVENLFKKNVTFSKDLDSFVNSCVSRRYPRGRIQRNLTHVLLGLGHRENRKFQQMGPAYIRILGSNNRGRDLIRIMRSTSTIPVITRASAPLTLYSKRMMDFEHRSGEIWECLVRSPWPEHEKKSIPLML
jgi:predicted nucleotidyltransferase